MDGHSIDCTISVLLTTDSKQFVRFNSVYLYPICAKRFTQRFFIYAAHALLFTLLPRHRSSMQLNTAEHF